MSEENQESIGPVVTIQKLSEFARVEQVAPGVIDIYPALRGQVVLVNGSAMHAPVDLAIELQNCSAMILPHPIATRKSQLYTENGVDLLMPGVNKIDGIWLRNRNGAAEYVKPENPIARLVVFFVAGLDADIREHVKEEEVDQETAIAA